MYPLDGGFFIITKPEMRRCSTRRSATMLAAILSASCTRFPFLKSRENARVSSVSFRSASVRSGSLGASFSMSRSYADSWEHSKNKNFPRHSDDARQVGLLASFETASSWVAHPARDGVALIGDAAGASDPAYGCGLALTLRDVRVMRDHLCAESDWRRAADRYAIDHDQYFDAMKRIIDWRTEMNHSTGPAADARRAHAGPLMRQDPTRAPDMHGLGPEAPSNDLARRRYFGAV